MKLTVQLDDIYPPDDISVQEVIREGILDALRAEVRAVAKRYVAENQDRLKWAIGLGVEHAVNEYEKSMTNVMARPA